MATNGEATKDSRIQIRAHLKKMGIKQQWLADRTGFSKSYLSNVLSGRQKLNKRLKTKFNRILKTNY